LQHRSVGIDLSEVLITDFIQLPTSVGATGPQVFRVPGTSGAAGQQGIQGPSGVMGPQGIQDL
jgi:hypothetical protein